MNVSPSSLSLGGIPEGYSNCTPGGIRDKQGFNGEAGRQSGMPSGLPLVHPYPILVVELGGTSMSPAWVRDRLSLTGKEKLWCKVCLHPHLEQGGMPPVEKMALVAFFISYRWELTIPASLL